MSDAAGGRGIQALWLCPMASAHASSSCAAADVARALLLLSSAWRAVEILRPRLRLHAGRFVKGLIIVLVPYMRRFLVGREHLVILRAVPAKLASGCEALENRANRPPRLKSRSLPL